MAQSNAAQDEGNHRQGVLTDELGTSGLRQQGGEIEEEFLSKLVGQRGQKVYREMRDNDATIGSMLLAAEKLISGAEWSAAPPTTGTDADRKKDFLLECMNDMEVPWKEHVTEAFTMAHTGFAPHEIVYKYRRGYDGKLPDGRHSPSDFTDGKIGWYNLPLRGQETVLRWGFEEHGEVTSMVQEDPNDFREIEIPIDKLLLYRTTVNKGNPEGRPMLRNAYRSWFIKKRVEELEAIAADRDLAGIPRIYVPKRLLSTKATADDKALLLEIKRMARNIAADRQSTVILPAGFDEHGNRLYEMNLMGSAGNKLIDTDAVIKRHDTRIAEVMLAGFILLGHDKVGSYALSSDKTNLFGIVLGSIMDTMCESFNRQAVPRLFRVNGIPGPYPRITHGDIEKPDIEVTFKALQTAVTLEIIEADEDLEGWARRVLGAPAKAHRKKKAA